MIALNSNDLDLFISKNLTNSLMKLSLLVILIFSIILCQSYDQQYKLSPYGSTMTKKENNKILFIVDTSKYVSVPNFKTIHDVLENVLYEFPVEDEYHYALYSFSDNCRAHTENSWKKLTVQNFREDKTKVQHVKAEANLDKVIRHINDDTNLLEKEGSTTALILIDGELNKVDETVKELLRMQEKGAKTIVVAFGEPNEEFLAKVPGQYVHYQNPVDFFEMLESIKADYIKADIAMQILPQKKDKFKISDPLEVIIRIENNDEKGRIIKDTTKIEIEAFQFLSDGKPFFVRGQKIKLDRNIQPGQYHYQTLSLKLNGGNLHFKEFPETFRVHLHTKPDDPIILPISNVFKTNTSK